MRHILPAILLLILVGCHRDSPNDDSIHPLPTIVEMPRHFQSLVDPDTLVSTGRDFHAVLHALMVDYVDTLEWGFDMGNPEDQFRRYSLSEEYGIIDWNQFEFYQAVLFFEQRGIPDVSPIFSALIQLHLRPGYRLGLFPAIPIGVGSISQFYPYQVTVKDYSNPYLDDFESRYIASYLTFDESPEAIWQYYLLVNAYQVLPTWWHGGYCECKYIFTADDLDSITVWDYEKDTSLYIFAITPLRDSTKRPDFRPSIQHPNDSTYVIRCCLWNNWIGLYQQRTHIYVDKNHRIKAFKDQPLHQEEIFFPYDCGICY